LFEQEIFAPHPPGLGGEISPLPIKEKFPTVRDDAIALRIGFFLNVDLKIDGAHDAVDELSSKENFQIEETDESLGGRSNF
jgi:hypothetical protein